MISNFIALLRRTLYFDNWPIVIFQRLFYRRARLLAFRHGEIEFVADYSGDDQSGVLVCLTSDMYSRYFKVLNKSKSLRVLDLGANAGGFCLALRAAGFAFEKIVCVEMNRQTYSRLQLNITQNFKCDAVILNAAVAGNKGTVHVRDSHGGTSDSLYARSSGDVKLVEVDLVTLDDLVGLHFGMSPDIFVDICKIDVECAEFDILHSGTCQLIRRVKHLIIEIHPHETKSEAELISRIKSFGFNQVDGATPREQNVYYFCNSAIP